MVRPDGDFSPAGVCLLVCKGGKQTILSSFRSHNRCAIQYDISIWMDLCGSSIHPGIAGFYLRSGVVKAKHMEGNDPDGDARHWDCRDPGGDPSVSFRMKVFPAQKIECQPPLDSCDWFLSCVIKCRRALSSRILRH